MPLRAGREAAKEVAAADDHGGLHAELLDLADIGGDAARHSWIDSILLLAHEGFARELEEYAAVDGRHGLGRL